MSRVRLLLTDEQRLCLNALRKLLADEFDVVATTSTDAELVSEVERLKPAVVLLRMLPSNLAWFRAIGRISRNFQTRK
jgi:DNA-binding NarL/FixJ family response regulator